MIDEFTTILLQSINPDNWLGIKYNWNLKLPPYGPFFGTTKRLFDPIFVTPQNWLGFNRYWSAWAPSCEVTDSLSTLIRETARFYQTLGRVPRSLTKCNPLECRDYLFYANHYNRVYYYNFWNSSEPLTLEDFLRDKIVHEKPLFTTGEMLGIAAFILLVYSTVTGGPFTLPVAGKPFSFYTE